jgi:hypothetical protein
MFRYTTDAEKNEASVHTRHQSGELINMLWRRINHPNEENRYVQNHARLDRRHGSWLW